MALLFYGRPFLVAGALTLVVSPSTIAQVLPHWDEVLIDRTVVEIAALNDGDILVASETSFLGAAGSDVEIRRMTATGGLSWAANYDGPTSGQDHLEDFELAGDGRMYFCGTHLVGAEERVFLVAMSSDGSTLWERSHPVDSPFTDDRSSLSVAPNGDVTVAAQRSGKALVFRYSSAGTLRWERTFSGDGSLGLTRATDVEVAANGTTYVTGNFNQGAVTGPWVFFVAALNLAGNLQWLRAEDGDLGVVLDAPHLRVDAASGAFLIGTSESPCGVHEFRAVKYTSSGATVWNVAQPGFSCENREVADAELTPDGDLLIAGWGQTNGISYITTRIDGTTGVVEWTRSLSSPSGLVALANDVSVGEDGVIYVTGNTDLLSATRDITTVCYLPDGTEAWKTTRPEDLFGPVLAIGSQGDLTIGAGELLVHYQSLVSSAPDCNQNGVPDDCDIADQTSLDHDADGRPDECQLLSVDTQNLSISTGGVQTLSLHAGPSHAGDSYWMLGSITGAEPGIGAGSVQIPLNPDAYFLITATTPTSGAVSPALGLLGSQGDAQATLPLPSGLPAALAGLRVHHAFLVLDPAGFISDVSNPVFAELTP